MASAPRPQQGYPHGAQGRAVGPGGQSTAFALMGKSTTEKGHCDGCPSPTLAHHPAWRGPGSTETLEGGCIWMATLFMEKV